MHAVVSLVFIPCSARLFNHYAFHPKISCQWRKKKNYKCQWGDQESPSFIFRLPFLLWSQNPVLWDPTSGDQGNHTWFFYLHLLIWPSTSDKYFHPAGLKHLSVTYFNFSCCRGYSSLTQERFWFLTKLKPFKRLHSAITGLSGCSDELRTDCRGRRLLKSNKRNGLSETSPPCLATGTCPTLERDREEKQSSAVLE